MGDSDVERVAAVPDVRFLAAVVSQGDAVGGQTNQLPDALGERARHIGAGTVPEAAEWEPPVAVGAVALPVSDAQRLVRVVGPQAGPAVEALALDRELVEFGVLVEATRQRYLDDRAPGTAEVVVRVGLADGLAGELLVVVELCAIVPLDAAPELRGGDGAVRRPSECLEDGQPGLVADH